MEKSLLYATFTIPSKYIQEVCKEHDNRKVTKALLLEQILEHDTGKTVRIIPSKKTSVKVYTVKETIFSWKA